MSNRKTLTADPQQLVDELRRRLDPSGRQPARAHPRLGTAPIFVAASRSENGTVPFTPASGTARNPGCQLGPPATDGGRPTGPSFCPELTYGRHRGPATPDFRPAAVVALFYSHGGEWHLPLTLRPAHLNDHAGQVSLPGGAREVGETDEQCALRELGEELGVAEAGIHVVGRLSRIFVYASNFLVEPIVAVTDDTPVFLPDPIEVEQLLEMPIAHLFDAANYRSHRITRRATAFRAPSILYRNYHIWGATAMILSELNGVLSEILGSDET